MAVVVTKTRGQMYASCSKSSFTCEINPAATPESIIATAEAITAFQDNNFVKDLMKNEILTLESEA